MVVVDRQQIRDEILARVEQRGLEKTICPSEVARGLGTASTWRDLMDVVREVGCELAAEGLIHVTQKGIVVEDPTSARGPIRYRLAKSANGRATDECT